MSETAHTTVAAERTTNKGQEAHPCSLHGEHVLTGWRTASSTGCPELWARMVDTVLKAIERAGAATRAEPPAATEDGAL